MKKHCTLFLLSFLLTCCTFARNKSSMPLQKEIEKMAAGKKADIGISILGPGPSNVVSINGGKLYPMLSTFKLPVALFLLSKVERGELAMNRQLFVRKEELLENTWSPFRKEHPAGNIRISLEEAITWMMVYSDNNITDILLRLAGGPAAVEKFFSNKNIIIRNNEEQMHRDWDSQFVNRITPAACTALLKRFYEGKILNKKHTQWLYRTMTNSKTGIKRIKGKLPDGVVVAHRAGTSFTNEAGVTGAINNVGIIELPGGRCIFIAVFVHNTTEKFETGEEIIADIAKATWEYYLEQ